MSASPPAPWATGAAILRLLRWHKPAGRLILMIPALWGAFLAGRGIPPWPLVGIIILGTLATSGAGCVINDLWDRNLDPLVERTRNRPLASRELTVGVAIITLLVSLACAAGLALFLNPVSFALCVAAVPVILLYPAAKRVFPVPQLVLALAWGFAVLISWTAVSGQDPETPLWEGGLAWLWLATVLWTLGFDTVYALSDREDDERAGIHSSARFFGRLTPTAVGFFFLGTSIALLGVGLTLGLHGVYFASWVIATSMWGRQTWQLHQVDAPPTLYPAIFGQNVVQGFILLAGMIGGSLLA
ncbi:4-hydroxybenzoate solanesyltransferase [Thermostichus vulcanus]|uniref:4-hydroxybenzoate solanesyltransferase n=1 Tax=Thermostichus vulcanus str. 'Rupite' TaxID=2813851 RepID=A0ABT0C6N7_THEVL|nr:4-hydroxybenzoate solanesyltransferase [Thermostichus vulcanus]MCJ2541364.1 4-hydroxybenzoate solanesyltransferase [Thermostichus vulcanus str. 'Rupite']